MPFYRYQCEECKDIFRVLQTNGGGPPTVCPECGGERIERLIPRIGVVYKGNGYYSTDYGNRGRGKKSKESKETTSAKGEG